MYRVVGDHDVLPCAAGATVPGERSCCSLCFRMAASSPSLRMQEGGVPGDGWGYGSGVVWSRPAGLTVGG